MSKTMLDLTEPQRRSLQIVANHHGHDWRRELCQRWMNGTDVTYDQYTRALERMGLECCYLRQVRNSFGPSWLHSVCTIEPYGDTCEDKTILLYADKEGNSNNG